MVTEAASAGTDTVNASITFSLAALTNIENLTLIGSANINGTGHAGNNALTMFAVSLGVKVRSLFTSHPGTVSNMSQSNVVRTRVIFAIASR